MAALDEAFPGRVIGAQVLHGVTFEGNYPWPMIDPAFERNGSWWPDYSPDAVAEFCGGAIGGGAPCAVPSAAECRGPAGSMRRMRS